MSLLALLGKAPGHYNRLYNMEFSGAPEPPVAHWPDRAPLSSNASLQERLDHWLTLVMLMGMVFMLSWVRNLSERGGIEEGPLWGLGMLVMFLPAVQLVASVVAMFLAAVTDWDDAAARVWAVAKITLGTVIGTAIGIGLLFLFCVGLRGF